MSGNNYNLAAFWSPPGTVLPGEHEKDRGSLFVMVKAHSSSNFFLVISLGKLKSWQYSIALKPQVQWLKNVKFQPFPSPSG